MAAPPLEAGAVKAMLALALPAVAAPMVGAPGTVVVVVEVLELPPPHADTIQAANSVNAKGAKVDWLGRTCVIRFLRKVECVPGESGGCKMHQALIFSANCGANMEVAAWTAQASPTGTGLAQHATVL
jgi:hypothetical protein